MHSSTAAYWQHSISLYSLALKHFPGDIKTVWRLTTQTLLPRLSFGEDEPSLLDLNPAMFIGARRYRKQPLGWQEKNGKEPSLVPLVSKKTRRTNSKHKLLILKARSQMERDAWCWALNAEVERTVRALA